MRDPSGESEKRNSKECLREIELGVKLSRCRFFMNVSRCTACCRWPGDVGFADGEIARLAAFKGMSGHEFIQSYTRSCQDRTGLALQEKPNGECIFLDGNDCSVQPVKPQQCQDFPNLWNFPGFERQCCAIPRLVGEDEWRRLVKQATGREPAVKPVTGVT
jgi:hypothetical protein